MKKSAPGLLALLLPLIGLSQDLQFFTGTYTHGKSKGIYTVRFREKESEGQVISVAEGIRNPSFLALSPGGQYLYAVSELNSGGDGGEVVAYRVEKSNGSLTRLNSQKSGGDDPCYVTVDKTGRWVIVGNYSSGSVAVLPVQADGHLGKAVTRVVHEGSGPNKERQEKPHVHATVLSPDNRFLYVPDLGTDKIFIYRFDAANGSLSPAAQPFRTANPGSGPRHFVLHPSGKFAYLIEELTGTVSAYTVNPQDGSLDWTQRISSLPEGFKGFAGSADIHLSPDGRFLYASNRGDANSIAVFSVHKRNGSLKPLSHPSVQGIHPRNFSLTPDGKFLLCANRDSDQIVIFARNRKTGMLTDTGKRISIPSPVCILWMVP